MKINCAIRYGNETRCINELQTHFKIRVSHEYIALIFALETSAINGISLLHL